LINNLPPKEDEQWLKILDRFAITPEAREAGKKAAEELMASWDELTQKSEYDLMVERGIPPEIADKWMKEIDSERR
jgi:hypothetical protein